ncbi:hypothetical protein COCMIDRAFT_95299 [Bipolaris oryzae ATCC 44560]|uniref:CFEM domain-containing protein n=1 Tax=Bipolaris oryzae ATCC 44560 TaxID=930090 RepID=W6Z6D3_COCMI|nr:uncharacterized protein COCMIDRAFT_95299 [Bipolaris oryzae ATCC 44560]EUC45555.1 hypothetical protein COCMIDRAFT_95299 [Bipolaris oryzae ATCC 44560]
MKTFTIASIVALASVASAQLDNIPQCALSCFVGPLTSDGCANLTDFACHCKKGDTLLAQVQPCVQKGCEAADQAKAIAAVESTCQAAGVPITIPDTGAPAQSSAPAASASASASAAPAPSSAASAASSPRIYRHSLCLALRHSLCYTLRNSLCLWHSFFRLPVHWCCCPGHPGRWYHWCRRPCHARFVNYYHIFSLC